LRDVERWVNLRGAQEFGECLLQFALFAQEDTVMHARGRGLRTRPQVRRPVAQLLGLQVVRLLVELEGLLKVLAGLGVDALLVERLCLVRRGREGDGEQERQDGKKAPQEWLQIRCCKTPNNRSPWRRPILGTDVEKNFFAAS
jgi:hypothetical protein